MAEPPGAAAPAEVRFRGGSRNGSGCLPPAAPPPPGPKTVDPTVVFP